MKKQKPMSFDDLLKDLQGQRTVQEDPHYVPLDKLFNATFLSKHSSIHSFGELMEKGNFQATTREEINNILEELLDRHIARETDFTDWHSMLDAATKEYAANR